MSQTNSKVTVIGGGTGSFVVISALKHLPVDISAVISVADSGGSTGRLRDEFGFLPVGDLRQALAALAQNHQQDWIQKLLLYRFTHGSGLEGHNLGNLIITALQDMSGSTAKSLEIASRIFRLNGHIYPITTQNVQLVVEYTDGTIVIGEHHLNPAQGGGKKIKSVKLSPRASIYPKAAQSLVSSDTIIIGPGDLYASLAPNLIVSGIKPVFRKTKAKIIFVVNLMTSYAQTHNLSAAGHLKAIEGYIGRTVDGVIINNQPIPASLLKAYAKQHEFPVIDDLPAQNDPRLFRTPLIRRQKVETNPHDTIIRSYLRHDPKKLGAMLKKII
jgi:uncharacterized cofD-like protein